MNLPKLELYMFSSDGLNFAFHPPTYTIFRINSIVHYLLKGYTDGISVKELSIEFNIKENDIYDLLEKITNKILQSSLSEDQQQNHIVGKLVLHISNKCNLRCKYCYAVGGTYGVQQGLMTNNIVIKTLDTFYRYFDNINYILFFGGEPLLNLRAIEVCCNYITSMYNNGTISKIPILALVTNGTILRGEIINLINKYKIKVCFSLDGPKKVHDQLRIYPNGKGTFKKITKNIKILTNRINLPCSYEATYTRKHSEVGMSMRDVAKYIETNFNLSFGTIAPVIAINNEVTGNGEIALEDFEDVEVFNYLNEGFNSLLTDRPSMSEMIVHAINAFALKRPLKFICPIGREVFAVSFNGDIYPCHLFVGKPEFKMGNVRDIDFANPSDEFKQVLDNTHVILKENNAKCRTCWIRNLCILCPGRIFYSTGGLKEIPESFCSVNKRLIEKMIARLSIIQKNPDQWKKFLKNLKKLSELKY